MERGSRLSIGKPPVVQVSVKACKERNSCVVEGIACESGASVLFDVMHDNLSAVDLYSRWGKVRVLHYVTPETAQYAISPCVSILIIDHVSKDQIIHLHKIGL